MSRLRGGSRQGTGGGRGLRTQPNRCSGGGSCQTRAAVGEGSVSLLSSRDTLGQMNPNLDRDIVSFLVVVIDHRVGLCESGGKALPPFWRSRDNVRRGCVATLRSSLDDHIPPVSRSPGFGRKYTLKQDRRCLALTRGEGLWMPCSASHGARVGNRFGASWIRALTAVRDLEIGDHLERLTDDDPPG